MYILVETKISLQSFTTKAEIKIAHFIPVCGAVRTFQTALINVAYVTNVKCKFNI